MSKSRKQPKKSTSKATKQVQKSTNTKKSGLGLFLFKIFVLLGIVWGVVKYYDSSGLFEPDQLNNHTQKKWDALYRFTKKHDVDVYLVGNSHMYNGINPKTLSSATSANNFILASPGTRISDTYYCVKEAIALNKPKMVVVETYGIKGFDQMNLNPVALSDQFKSFAARKNFLQKLISTPDLFNPDNYLLAWSNTVRNHSFLLSDREQIAVNKKLRKQKRKPVDKLYLGRFIAYQEGIQKEVLDRYEKEGSPVDGRDYKYAEIADDYVQKIAELCRENDVKLLFLTLPMYEKHVENYDDWKQELAKIIDKTYAPWLDMQQGANYDGFNTTSFQNTYKENQHLTYNGSIIATYKLADYLLDNYSDILPDRSKEQKWHQLFYGEEGYFEHHPVKANDKTHMILARNLPVNNVEIDEIISVKLEKNRKLIAKINKQKYPNDWSKYKLRLLLTYKEGGQAKQSYAELPCNKYIEGKNHYIFQLPIKELNIINLESAYIVAK